MTHTRKQAVVSIPVAVVAAEEAAIALALVVVTVG